MTKQEYNADYTCPICCRVTQHNDRHRLDIGLRTYIVCKSCFDTLERARKNDVLHSEIVEEALCTYECEGGYAPDYIDMNFDRANTARDFTMWFAETFSEYATKDGDGCLKYGKFRFVIEKIKNEKE